MNKSLILISCLLFFLNFFLRSQIFQGNKCLRFDFGKGEAKNGFVKVTCNDIYNKNKGYGFIGNTKIESVVRRKDNNIESDYCISATPFYFIVDVPEGNYLVTVTLGDLKEESITTIKGESRRLFFYKIITKKGEIKKVKFSINVRTPIIGYKDSIKIKPREKGYLNWDNKLTLEFSNQRPCICAVEIERIDNPIIQVFLAGNSTVTDQEKEPYSAWGQMLSSFFDENIVVVNLAESGETMKSFENSGRLRKLLSMLNVGDYVFIQFGHNDQKPGGNFLDANTTYKEYLKKYIHIVKEKGGQPVLVSSMHRRTFDENGKIVNTHGRYLEAMKEVAIEEKVPFINLNEMSKSLYEALGVENSKLLFVHYPANSFPGQTEPLSDNSHHSTYGAYQLAKCVIKGIIENNLPLKDYLRDKNFYYDPGNPDSYLNWDLPLSPVFDMIKPEGY